MSHTDDELRQLLSTRLRIVQDTIFQSCARSGRDPASVQLIAVTKSVSARVIQLSEELGLRSFAENRPQTLWAKAEALPNREWHFIGHLQRNKVDRTLPLVAMFHSIDSLRLLESLNEWGKKLQRRPKVFLEFNCSREAAKGGFAPEQLAEVAEQLPRFDQLDCVGLMTMAAYSADIESARPTFRELRQLAEQLRDRTGLTLPELSMGMSQDYAVAIEEGSTFIRIGSTLYEGLDAE